VAPQERLDVAVWEDEMLSSVLKVTLDVRLCAQKIMWYIETFIEGQS
jgi:hypothetical protein